MIKTLTQLFTASALFFSLIFSPASHADDKSNTDPIKVVYQINDATRAAMVLRNVQNHLQGAPGTKIAVVGHAGGIDFMLNNAKDANGNPYNVAVENLKAKGVTFDVCEITLRSRKLDKQQFIPEVSYVPSGVAEISKLQAREGYVYLKP